MTNTTINNHSDCKDMKIYNLFIIDKRSIEINNYKIKYPYIICKKKKQIHTLLHNIIKLSDSDKFNGIFKGINNIIEVGKLCNPEIIIKFIKNIYLFDMLDQFIILDKKSLSFYLKGGKYGNSNRK